MSIKVTYLVACDACGRECSCFGDDQAEAIEVAADEGYQMERVPNGSMWYFCSKCYKKYKEGLIA